jgi:hypothetical protein
VKRPVFSFALVAFALTLPLAACSRQPAPSAAAPAVAPAPSQGGPAAMPASANGAAPGSVETVTGQVVETFDASTYTYLRVKTAKGDLWAATAKTPVKVGETVTVPLESEMRDFHSPSLNRDFPLIYFVTQIGRDGQPVPPPMAVGHGTGPAMGMGGGAPASQAPVTVKPMAPPAGGSSIADVWAKRTALAGKTVTINGTVVKYNGGILGRNWLHVQDGSGKADEGTNDITVTTDAPAKVGDVVTVTGKVVVDKDLGSGYAYKVLIEDAKIK